MAQLCRCAKPAACLLATCVGQPAVVPQKWAAAWPSAAGQIHETTFAVQALDAALVKFTPSVNGIAQNLIPTVIPCNLSPITRSSLFHFGGVIRAEAFHLLLAAYPRFIRRGQFSHCINVVIENGSSQPIELPIQIAGSLYGSQDFGDQSKSFANGRLRVWGSVGNESFDRSVTNSIVNSIFEESTINEVVRMTVAPGTGRHTASITVFGMAELVLQAKSTGPFGFIGSKALAGIDFPNSIDVGMFTGPNGTPLPPGVKITDEETGVVYANTLPTLFVLRWNSRQVDLGASVVPANTYALQSSSDLVTWKTELSKSFNSYYSEIPIHSQK